MFCQFYIATLYCGLTIVVADSYSSEYIPFLLYACPTCSCSDDLSSFDSWFCINEFPCAYSRQHEEVGQPQPILRFLFIIRVQSCLYAGSSHSVHTSLVQMKSRWLFSIQLQKFTSNGLCLSES